jgi:lysozyme family protein
MAALSYAPSLARLLTHEGGYTNHPADPGGPTNFGITIYDYRKYVQPGATAADVRAMRVEEAKRIYRAKYWDAQRCDELPAGVDDCVFDYGVNSGIGRSKKVLQRVVGVKDDGVLGPQTMQAVAAREPRAIINAICDERLKFLHALKTWLVFGKGWGRRVAEVRTFSLQLAAASPHQAAFAISAAPPITSPAAGEMAKAIVPLHPAAKALAEHGGELAAGAGTAGALGTAQNENAWHWMGQHPFELAGLIVGAGVLIVGTQYALRRWHQSQQEAATPGLTPVPAAA